MHDELEREAVALVKQYRGYLLMAPGLKSFFKRLADRLGWQNLKGELK